MVSKFLLISASSLLTYWAKLVLPTPDLTPYRFYLAGFYWIRVDYMLFVEYARGRCEAC